MPVTKLLLDMDADPRAKNRNGKDVLLETFELAEVDDKRTEAGEGNAD